MTIRVDYATDGTPQGSSDQGVGNGPKVRVFSGQTAERSWHLYKAPLILTECAVHPPAGLVNSPNAIKGGMLCEGLDVYGLDTHSCRSGVAHRSGRWPSEAWALGQDRQGTGSYGAGQSADKPCKPSTSRV